MPHRAASLVLAIDIGSSSTRAAFFTGHAKRLPDTAAGRHYAISYSAAGAAELDPAILLRSARSCVRETLAKYAASAELRDLPIVALSGSAFWHGLLGLDRAGKPVTPVFSWADSRSNAHAARLRTQFEERQVQLRTGCMLRAQCWPSKLRWLRRTNRTLFERVRRWTSPACWIFGELFGVDIVSHSMASGTGLYNLERQNWDAELCRACSIREDQLDSLGEAASPPKGPRALRSATVFSALGDGAASNLGSGADRDGLVAINLGTSGAVRTIQSNPDAMRELPFGLFRYVLSVGRLVIGGAISNAGNLHQWCTRELQIASEAGGEQALSRTAAATDALVVLPFWVDERAPSWPEHLHGTISGFTQATTASDVLRAVQTSTFYRLADILEHLETVSQPIEQVIVSGGILHSAAALRILADAIGRDIRVSPELESSLRGAAVHALVVLGLTPGPLPTGKLVRFAPALAATHRERRDRQNALERLLVRQTDARATPARAHRRPRPARKRSSG